MSDRENRNTSSQWHSSVGFVAAAAGSAVGLGNIWKFPYITGENGGGTFVLFYLLCIVVLGLPIMDCRSNDWSDNSKFTHSSV